MEIIYLVFVFFLFVNIIGIYNYKQIEEKIPYLSEVELQPSHIALFMFEKQKAVEAGQDETKSIRRALQAVMDKIAKEQGPQKTKIVMMDKNE